MKKLKYECQYTLLENQKNAIALQTKGDRNGMIDLEELNAFFSESWPFSSLLLENNDGGEDINEDLGNYYTRHAHLELIATGTYSLFKQYNRFILEPVGF